MNYDKRSSKPKVYFHSRYDGDSLHGNHLRNVRDALIEFFDLCSSSEADYSVSLDYSAANLKLIQKQNIPSSKRFLIVREPRQVHPYPHSNRAKEEFGSIFYLGTVVRPSGQVRFWPYTREFTSSAAQFAANTSDARDNKVVAVASWRVSFVRGSLYSLRAKAYSRLSIDTFGRDWDAPLSLKTKEVIAQVLMAAGNESGLTRDFAAQIFSKPSDYKGSLVSKFETLQRYKATLIIENSTEYMSEKVLDALACATIPIYCGTSLTSFGIPDDLFVDCAPNLQNIREAISKTFDIDYHSWRARLMSWLHTDEGKNLFDEKLQWARLFAELRDRMMEEQLNEAR